MWKAAGVGRDLAPDPLRPAFHAEQAISYSRQRTRRRAAIGAALVAIVLAFALTWGPPRPTPALPGTFAFAAFGDAPYYPWEDLQFRLVLRDIDAHELAFATHVGDIFWRPCSDELFRKYRAKLDRLHAPLIYTPGDNEWTDCHEYGSGDYAPLERLERLRQIYFADRSRSLGATPLNLVSQADGPEYAEFVENARWSHDRVVFATAHIVGSRNGMQPFLRRTDDDDAAARRRTEAAAAWVREAFAEARRSSALAVVVVFHGNPGFEEPPDNPYRAASEPFIVTLEEEAEAFARPVLMVHGDDHEYIVDRPLTRRTTGRRLDNLTRLQVPGSPRVGWVRVVVSPGAADPFAFEERVVPSWKYW